MVFDFSKLNYEEDPVLLLKNLDNTVICPLSHAQELTAKLMYNEVSEISFKLPARVNGVETPHYDDVVGMRIVDWMGMGQFLLVNPKAQTDGLEEYKECQAYSLEYELNHKQIYMEEGTYDFWNPVARENTVIGIILSLCPSWSVGSIDADLWGKYRTFSVENESVYDFIKNTAQETYQCVFDFDTYERKINVRAASSVVAADPVYLSLDNLIKERTVDEDTENIFTCLDVNGAEDVDIRSVNPMGTNKIYNLDYFMERGYFTDVLKAKWESWKTTYENHKQPYYNITIEKVLQESRLETERAALTKLSGELSQYETLQSTYIEASAQGIDQGDNLATIKSSIDNKKAEISTKETLIEEIMDEVDALLQQQIAINQVCSFSAFFDEAELLLLDKHIKENSISEESFVYRAVSSYTAEDIAQTTQTVSMVITDATVTRVQNTTGKDIYSVVGGLLNMTVDGGMISAKVIRAALECKSDGSYVMTAYLNNGSYQEVGYPSGCISLTGAGCTITSDVVADSDIEGSYKEGTSVNLASATSNLYFTVNATEYAKRSVAWDLMEYGEAELEKLAWPAYTFSIDSSNFLALEDFLYFKNNFHLGNRVYLEMDNGEPLTPIVIGAEIEMDDPSSLRLIFSDTYSAKDNAFDIVSLLEESVSMGKKVSSSLGNFNAFIDSGASTSVKDFISSAIDYSKNKILSSSGQGVQIDDSGITLRKLKADGSGYEPEQIKMINNSIVFTNDDWASAVMAIGKFHDENVGDVWGIVAQAIVGTILAGSQLVIESAKKDGDIAVFRVDADGARLYNSRFDLVNEYTAGSSGQISLIPHIGFVGGKTTSTTPLFSYDEQGDITGIKTVGGNTITSAANIKSDDLPNANWFMDMDGNAYFKGTVYATNGRFSGTVYATDGEFTGTIHATDGDFSGAIKAATLEGDLVGAGGALKGVSLDVGDGNFQVDSAGNVIMAGNINLSGGNITWGKNAPDTGVTEDEVIDLIDEYGVSLPRYIKNTYISSTVVKSPTIKGNDMEVYGAYKVLDANDDVLGYMGAATGRDSWGNTTYGVAMSSQGFSGSMSDSEGDGDFGITYASRGNYVIATDGGCRMQSGPLSVVVTNNSATLNYNDTNMIRVSSSGCTYTTDGTNWKAIGSGSGTGGVAVFG